MSLTAHEIGVVVQNLQTEVVGAAVRKVISPIQTQRIVLELRTSGTNHYLQIVASADSARLGRVPGRPRTSARPHPFVSLLRRDAGGARLERIEQIDEDRVVVLHLASRTKGGALVCELTSRHGNLFWLDDSGRIQGSFFPNRSHRRLLVPGEQYVPPLPPPPRGAGNNRFEKDADIEEALERYYCDLEETRSIEQERLTTLRLVRRATAGLERLLSRIEQDLKRANTGERLLEDGELLKANLRLVHKGMNEVEVLDFTGRSRTVSLDPTLSATTNMDRLFSRAKRLRRAVAVIERRRRETVIQRSNLFSLAEEITKVTSLPRLVEAKEHLVRQYPRLGQQKGVYQASLPQRLPFKEVGIAAGRLARVGKSAADNDKLTLHHSQPDDLWLHVRGRTGSHVVVPLGRGEVPSAELLIDAAHLAAHFSDARGDPDVEITYTKRRYVQKPRGAPTGGVRLLREKTLMLRIDQGRLSTLLGLS